MANGLSPESYAFLVRELIQDANEDGVIIWIRPGFGSGYHLIASKADEADGKGIQADSIGGLVQDDD
jgi:hypothetical protein